MPRLCLGIAWNRQRPASGQRDRAGLLPLAGRHRRKAEHVFVFRPWRRACFHIVARDPGTVQRNRQFALRQVFAGSRVACLAVQYFGERRSQLLFVDRFHKSQRVQNALAFRNPFAAGIVIQPFTRSVEQHLVGLHGGCFACSLAHVHPDRYNVRRLLLDRSRSV